MADCPVLRVAPLQASIAAPPPRDAAVPGGELRNRLIKTRTIPACQSSLAMVRTERHQARRTIRPAQFCCGGCKPRKQRYRGSRLLPKPAGDCRRTSLLAHAAVSTPEGAVRPRRLFTDSNACSGSDSGKAPYRQEGAGVPAIRCRKDTGARMDCRCGDSGFLYNHLTHRFRGRPWQESRSTARAAVLSV